MASTTTKRTPKAKKAETPAENVKVETEVKDTPEVKKEETDLEKLVKEQAEVIAQLKAQLANSAASAKPESKEKIVFLWQAPVADYNVVEFGERGRFGRIVGNSGVVMIPKNELSQVMDVQIRHYLDLRWLIVLSGLDEDERELYGVNYKEGEYLSKEAFMDIIGTGDQILEIYPKLCASHKDIVARFYYEGWKEGRDVKRETVVALNKICRNDAFKTLIEEMNARDASEE